MQSRSRKPVLRSAVELTITAAILLLVFWKCTLVNSSYCCICAELDTQAFSCPFFTFLGCDHHNTVGSAGTIKSGCGCALKNIYRRNIIRVDVSCCVTVVIPLSPCQLT